MPIVHTNPCNHELKGFLKRNHITYADLAQASGYSKGTIDQWLIRPLSDDQKEIIQSSIDQIMINHVVPTLAPSCCNYRLRVTLMEQGISYSELSRRLGYRYAVIHQWITKNELSPQRRELIENAIKQIGEERRLSHED